MHVGPERKPRSPPRQASNPNTRGRYQRTSLPRDRRKTTLCHYVIGKFKGHLGGNDAVVSVGNIGNGPPCTNTGCPLSLDQIGLDGILHDHRNRAFGFQIGQIRACDRGITDQNIANAPLDHQVACQAQMAMISEATLMSNHLPAQHHSDSADQ